MAPLKKKDDKPTNKQRPPKTNVKHVADAWILISRPGRVYYFNTATGESVWSLNESKLSVGSLSKNKTKKYIEPTSPVDEQPKGVNSCKDDGVPVNETTPEVVNQPVIPPNAMYWPNHNYSLYGLQMPPMISQNGLSNQMTSSIMPSVFSSNGLSNQMASSIMASLFSSNGLSNQMTPNIMPPVFSSNGLPNQMTPSIMPPGFSSDGLANQMTPNIMPPVFSSNGLSNQMTPNRIPPVFSFNGLSNQMTPNIMPPGFSSDGLSNQMTPNVPPNIPPFGNPPPGYPQVFQPPPFKTPTVIMNPEIPETLSKKFKDINSLHNLNQDKDADAEKNMSQYASNDLRIKLMMKKVNGDTLPKTGPLQPMEAEEPNQLDSEIIETPNPPNFEEYVDEDGEQYAHESNYYQEFHRDIVSYTDLTDDATEINTVHDDQREVIGDECSDDSSSDDQIIALDLTPVFMKYGINTDKVFYIFADTNVFMNNLNFLVMFVNSGKNFRLIISRHLLNELELVAFNKRESHPNDHQAERGLRHLTNKIRTGMAIYVEELMLKIVKYEIGCPSGDDFMLTACLWLKRAGEQYTFLTNDKVLIAKTRTSKVNVVHIDEIKRCIRNQIIQIGTDRFMKCEDIHITTITDQTRDPQEHVHIDNRGPHSEKTIKLADIEIQQHQAPTSVTKKTKSQDAIVPEPPKKLLRQPQVSIHNTNQVAKNEPKVNITATNQQPANKPVKKAGNQVVWGFTTKNKSKFTRSFKKNTRAMKILNKVELITSSPCHNKDDNNDVFLFEITDGMMETNLKTRCEEWVSHYDQIMVDVLSQILQRNPESAKNIKPPPPWTITEATQCIKSMFSFDEEISRAANAFINLLMKHSDMRGMINKELTPEDFMKIFSYGVYLLDTMESVLTDIDDIEVAQRSLAQLLNNIKDGSESSQGVEIDSNGTGNATTNHKSNNQSTDAETVDHNNTVISTDAGSQNKSTVEIVRQVNLDFDFMQHLKSKSGKTSANKIDTKGSSNQMSDHNVENTVISTDAGSQNKSTVKIVRQVNLDFDFIKHLKSKSGKTSTNKNDTKGSSNQMSDHNVENIEVQSATDAGVKSAPTILRKFTVCPNLEAKLTESCERSEFGEDTATSDMHDDGEYPDMFYPDVDDDETYYDDALDDGGNYTQLSDGEISETQTEYVDVQTADDDNTDFNTTDVDDNNTDFNTTDVDDNNTDFNTTDVDDNNTDFNTTDVDDNNTDFNATEVDDNECYDDGEDVQDYPQTNNAESPQITEHQQSVHEESMHSEPSTVNKCTSPKSDLGNGPKENTKHLIREIKNVFSNIHSFCMHVQQSGNSLSSDPERLEIKKQTEDSEHLLKRLMTNFDRILEREHQRAEKNASDNMKYRDTIQKCKEQGSILLEALSYIASEIK